MTDDRLKTGGALEALTQIDDRLVKSLKGQILSGYRVGDLIGSGGMGVVFQGLRAEGDFERPAAIKVVPASLGASELGQRFRTEVQILAKLNHPSIAQLYDAGETSEGWPYLVLEHVDGEPIDQYCETNALSIEQRVKLMIDASRAVRFAHARLVVHRDLKPSNVLVDTSGRLKLLDFGIAKLLEPGTPEHTVGHRPMTPKYASPEQLLGADITIGSDIYQLGLLFLAIVSGETPNSSATLEDAVRKAASGEDAAIEARVAKAMPADLLAIISRCLHADPEDRYLDVNALVADLVRFQNGYPVEAHRGNRFYRLKKLVQRNVPATAFAILAVVIALGGTVYYTVNVNEARLVAEQRADTSRRMLTALSSLVTETFEGFIDQNAERQTGTAAVVESVLQDTVSVLREELVDEPAARSELLQVEGSIHRALGDYPSAERAFEEAAGYLSPDDNPDSYARVQLDRAGIALRMENFETARQLNAEVADLMSRTDVSDATRVEFLGSTGYLALLEHRYDDALTSTRDAIERERAASSPDKRILAGLYATKMQILERQNDYPATLDAAALVLDLLAETESEFSSQRVAPLRLSARVNVFLGNLETARTLLEEAMSIAKGNFGDVHPTVAEVHHTYGLLEYYSKNLEGAVGHVEEEIRILEELYGPDFGPLFGLLGNVAMLSTDIGESEKAAALFQRQREMLDPNAPEHRESWYMNSTNEARLRRGIGDYEAAVALERRGLDYRAQLFGPDSIEVADGEDDVALALYKLGRHDEARTWFLKGAEKYRVKFGDDSEEYRDKMLYYWRYDVVEGNLTAARDKLHELMMEDIEADEVDAIWPVHMFTDLAHINLRLQDMERANQAIDWARTGADTAPRHPWAAYTDLVEAEIRLAENDYEEARRLAARAIERMETRFPMHTQRLDRARRVLRALP